MSRPLSTLAAMVAIISLTSGASALAQTVYSGTGAAASAAAASFAAAIGASTLETFDTRTEGDLAPSWTYDGGETATLSNGFGVTSAFPYGGGAVSAANGYGAYPNGGIGGSPVFSFTSSLRAFGAYFVDLEVPDVLIFSLSGGGTQRYDLPLGGQGGVTFFGADFGVNTITGVSFALGDDEALLIDDVRVATAAIPEPATWALMIAGFGLAGSALRTRRRTLARA